MVQLVRTSSSVRKSSYPQCFVMTWHSPTIGVSNVESSAALTLVDAVAGSKLLRVQWVVFGSPAPDQVIRRDSPVQAGVQHNLARETDPDLHTHHQYAHH